MKILKKKPTVFLLSIVILLIFASSAGCIKQLPGFTEPPPATTPAPETLVVPENTVEITPIVDQNAPVQTFALDEIDAAPYFTPDPYRIPYRNLSNESSSYSFRKTGKVQSAKHIVLGSNTSAFRINIPEGPLFLDLTFVPQVESPDQTGDTGSSYPDEGGSSDDSSEDSGSPLSGAYSFVYPYAEIVVIDSVTNGTVAKDGYGKTYSSDKTKTIPVYREGTYIVTVTGDFVTIDMKILTGPTVTPEITPGPVSWSPALPEDEWDEW